MDDALISETLETLSDPAVARKTRKNVSSLRGIRGVPYGEVARIAAAAWVDDPPSMPDDEFVLNELFAAAWEDGLVAIGLLAACTPDAPDSCLDLGLDWLGRVDDGATADALGWLVLGPAALRAGHPIDQLVSEGRAATHPAARRAVVMAGMAMTPEPIEGPSAAPLRARIKEKRVAFVQEPLSDGLAVIATGFARDDNPMVRKALRRLIRTWAKHAPADVVEWAGTVAGGLHKMYGEEVRKAAKRAAGLAAAEDSGPTS